MNASEATKLCRTLDLPADGQNCLEEKEEERRTRSEVECLHYSILVILYYTNCNLSVIALFDQVELQDDFQCCTFF